jgi:hypothetical protein
MKLLLLLIFLLVDITRLSANHPMVYPKNGVVDINYFRINCDESLE